MTTTPKTLTTIETEKVLKSLLHDYGTDTQKDRGIRDHTMGLLMLDAGLRVGECVQLLQADLVIACRPVEALHVTAQISKSKRDRIVPLSQRCRQAIEKMIKWWWQHKAAIQNPHAFYSRAFLKPLTTRQVERIVKRAAVQSIGRPVHPHMLRHTGASRLARIIDTRAVQDWLGHKNLSSTQIYIHTNAEELKRAVETASKQNSDT